MSARSILALAASLVPLATAAAPASAHVGASGGGDPDGLLASLPTHAPAGVCYARVRQDAQYAPPGPAHARWRLQPGSPGPVWCLVTEPGAPPALIRGERAGWIRVLCDGDATPARIGGLQRRLHARGLYEGAESGRYDEATAAAMRRFQRERRMEGGGYLSLRSVAALEAGGMGAPPPPVATFGPSPGPGYGPGCCAVAAAPPPPPPVVTIRAPAPPRPRSPWLSWSGKSIY